MSSLSKINYQFSPANIRKYAVTLCDSSRFSPSFSIHLILIHQSDPSHFDPLFKLSISDNFHFSELLFCIIQKRNCLENDTFSRKLFQKLEDGDFPQIRKFLTLCFVKLCLRKRVLGLTLFSQKIYQLAKTIILWRWEIRMQVTKTAVDKKLGKSACMFLSWLKKLRRPYRWERGPTRGGRSSWLRGYKL